ncbi:MAG: hypothetical protein MUF45_06010 [Spirosomaceae bacterium]|nr:hypothetical protein [Spirosomataceae bacterium]
MKTTIIHLMLICLCNVCSAQLPTLEWQKTIGGAFYDRLYSIIETKDGNYVMVGYSTSNYSFDVPFPNRGYDDVLIAKMTKDGNLLWTKAYGGGGVDIAYEVVEMNDGNLYVAGETNSTNYDFISQHGQTDGFLLKLDALGNMLGVTYFGGNGNDQLHSLYKTSNNELLLTGFTESSSIFSLKGSQDYWVLKLDNLGNLLWQKNFGGSRSDYALSGTELADGNFAVCGQTLSMDGDVSYNAGDWDIWVIKLDTNGNLIWEKSSGGTLTEQSPKAILQDTDGNIWVFSESNSPEMPNNHFSRDYFITKLDNNGNIIFNNCYGGNGNDYPRGAINGYDNYIYINGETYSTDGDVTKNHADAEYWLTKIDKNGVIQWQNTYGGWGHDEGTDILLSYDNKIVLAGNAKTLTDDGDVTNNRGDDDFWILKFKQNETCTDILKLKKEIFSSMNLTLSAKEISASNIIQSSTQNLLYKSSRSSVLLPGFEVKQGAVFTAKVDDCSN